MRCKSRDSWSSFHYFAGSSSAPVIWPHYYNQLAFLRQQLGRSWPLSTVLDNYRWPNMTNYWRKKSCWKKKECCFSEKIVFFLLLVVVVQCKSMRTTTSRVRLPRVLQQPLHLNIAKPTTPNSRTSGIPHPMLIACCCSLKNQLNNNFKTDEYEVTTATTVEEAKTVLGAGFDYVTEKHGIMLFRRPNRFKKV